MDEVDEGAVAGVLARALAPESRTMYLDVLLEVGESYELRHPGGWREIVVVEWKGRYSNWRYSIRRGEVRFRHPAGTPLYPLRR